MLVNIFFICTTGTRSAAVHKGSCEGACNVMDIWFCYAYIRSDFESRHQKADLLVMLGLTNKGLLLWLTLISRAVLHSCFIGQTEREESSSAGTANVHPHILDVVVWWETAQNLAFSLTLNPTIIFSFSKPYIPLPLLCMSLESHRPTSSPEYKASSVHDPTPWPNAESFSSALRACSAWQCLCL